MFTNQTSRRGFANRILNNFDLDNTADSGNRQSINLPKQFNHLIFQMYKESDKLERMAREEIPRAFPITEPIAYPSSKFATKHSSEEYMGAVSKIILEDAYYPMELCCDLKQSIQGTRLILENLYPTYIDNGIIRLEARNEFTNVLTTLGTIEKSIEQIQKILLHSVGQSPRETVDHRQLRKLRAHIIKIGWEIINQNKLPHELFPEQLYGEIMALRNQQPTPENMIYPQDIDLNELQQPRETSSCPLDPDTMNSLLDDV